MQNVKEALGIIKNHIEEGNSLHIDFYYPDLFSISVYGIEEIDIDENDVLHIDNGNSMLIFDTACCKHLITRPVEEGTVISMVLNDITLDFVLPNLYDLD